VGCLSWVKALIKPRARPRKVQRVYIIDEPPVTLEVNGKRYECANVIQTPSGVLCVQYDGSVALIPQTQQQQVQQQG
jgi:hypothetical protein